MLGGTSIQDWGVLAFRLLLSLAAGAVIGWDRERAGKPAGLRTHMLISLGSALFVLASLGSSLPDSGTRAVQGVAAGVGFLGAGEIVHRSLRGRAAEVPLNLTSAAAVWVAAAQGVAAAYGLWQLVLLATGLTLFTLNLVKRGDHHDER